MERSVRDGHIPFVHKQIPRVRVLIVRIIDDGLLKACESASVDRHRPVVVDRGTGMCDVVHGAVPAYRKSRTLLDGDGVATGIGNAEAPRSMTVVLPCGMTTFSFTSPMSMMVSHGPALYRRPRVPYWLSPITATFPEEPVWPSDPSVASDESDARKIPENMTAATASLPELFICTSVRTEGATGRSSSSEIHWYRMRMCVKNKNRRLRIEACGTARFVPCTRGNILPAAVLGSQYRSTQ